MLPEEETCHGAFVSLMPPHSTCLSEHPDLKVALYIFPGGYEFVMYKVTEPHDLENKKWNFVLPECKSANFSYKGPDRKYFRLLKHTVSVANTVFLHKSGYRSHVNKGVWLFSDKTLQKQAER